METHPQALPDKEVGPDDPFWNADPDSVVASRRDFFIQMTELSAKQQPTNEPTEDNQGEQ